MQSIICQRKAWWDKRKYKLFNSKSQQLSNRNIMLPFFFYFGVLQNSCISSLQNGTTTCSISSPACRGGCIFENTLSWMVALATWRRCWHFWSNQPSSSERLHSWSTLSSLNTAAFISHTSLPPSLHPSLIQPSVFPRLVLLSMPLLYIPSSETTS